MQTSCAILLIAASIAVFADGPGDRHHHALAYDAGSQRVILFGGTRSENGTARFMSDLWAWDGRTWTTLAAETTTRRMSGHYLFGRPDGALFSVGGTPGAIERWSGSSWEPTPADLPVHTGAATAYDTHRGRYVTVGGLPRPGVVSDEMWEFDGTSWEQRGGPRPPARGLAAMAYDERRRLLVLFGGRLADRTVSGETWTWDGKSWTRLDVTGPGPRMNHGMVYDAVRGEVVLFGGSGQGTPRLNETWLWNGAAWRQAEGPAPPARGGPGLAFDRARGVTVLFGGSTDDSVRATLGDTWEWNGRAWRLAHPGR